MLWRQPPPHPVPLGQGAFRPERELRGRTGQGTLAVRQLPVHRIPGQQPSRRRLLRLHGWADEGLRVLGRKDAMERADRLLVRRRQRHGCPRRSREGHFGTPGRTPVQTQGHHGTSRPDHLQGLRRQGQRQGRPRLHGLLGRAERPQNGLFDGRRPHRGLQVVCRRGTQAFRPGQLPVYRPGGVLHHLRGTRHAGRRLEPRTEEIGRDHPSACGIPACDQPIPELDPVQPRRRV